MRINLTPQTVAQLLKLLEQRCVKCGRPCLLVNKFCSFCGTENPNFDEAELEHQFGHSFSEVRDEVCNAGHPAVATYNWPVEYSDQPYCYLCGKKLY
jgi:hypothetical protein